MKMKNETKVTTLYDPKIQRINYDVYKFSKKEILKNFIQSAVLCLLADYLFYEQYWILAVMIPIPFMFVHFKRKRIIKERKKVLNYQFKDMLVSLSVSIQAGHSVESGISACISDLERIYEKGADILEELKYIERQKGLSVTMEELFFDLGKRSGVEDIENFASVFYTAKRTGGDMNRVIQKVAKIIGDKVDVSKEIEANLAAKKSEQLLMSFMPAGMIAYLKLTSPGFLDILYGNWFGIAAMTICLGIYIGAYWMGNKIVEIEV